MPDEIRTRLTHIEEIAEDRPGEALDELQAVTADLPGGVGRPSGSGPRTAAQRRLSRRGTGPRGECTGAATDRDVDAGVARTYQTSTLVVYQASIDEVVVLCAEEANHYLTGNGSQDV